MKSDPRSEAVGQREAWYRLATRCAAQIRKQCGTPDKETEQRILRVFRSALRPRRRAGRKPGRETVRGAELWVRGMLRFDRTNKRELSVKRYQRRLWQQIYHEILPDFTRLDKLTRQYRTTALRRNVKAYLNRNGRKCSRNIPVSTPMQTANV